MATLIPSEKPITRPEAARSVAGTVLTDAPGAEVEAALQALGIDAATLREAVVLLFGALAQDVDGPGVAKATAAALKVKELLGGQNRKAALVLRIAKAMYLEREDEIEELAGTAA